MAVLYKQKSRIAAAFSIVWVYRARYKERYTSSRSGPKSTTPEDFMSKRASQM